MPLSEMVEPKNDLAKITQLTKSGSDVLRQFAEDDFNSGAIAESLLALPFAMVDPRMTVELPDDLDLQDTFLVTDSNVTAFSWWVVGFPQIMNNWNVIARSLFNEQRTPD